MSPRSNLLRAVKFRCYYYLGRGHEINSGVIINFRKSYFNSTTIYLIIEERGNTYEVHENEIIEFGPRCLENAP